MQYEVQIIEDDVMPEGHDLLIVERGPGETPMLLLAGRPAEAFLAMRAYEASLEQCPAPSVLGYGSSLLRAG